MDSPIYNPCFISLVDSEIAEWLQVLIMCCCNGTSFDTQASAMSALLDLANVTYIGQSSKNSDSRRNVSPLITNEALLWIEKSNLYKVSSVCNGSPFWLLPLQRAEFTQFFVYIIFNREI